MLKKIITIVFLLIIPTLGLADSFPSYPISFWGEARINGENISKDSKIEAFCDNELIGEVILLEDGVYGYPESTKQKMLISSCETGVVFNYNGSEIRYGEEMDPGDVIEKDFYFKKDVEKEEEPSPPRGGGGGGRGSSFVDTEEDDEEEIVEGEVKGEAIEREQESEMSLDELKVMRDRLNQMKQTVNSIIDIVEDEDVKNTLLSALEDIEKLKERAENRIKEKEKELNKLRSQKERLAEINRTASMIIELLENNEEIENREEIKSSLLDLLERATEIKERIIEKIELI